LRLPNADLNMLPAITPEWTLFLDRDGVINYEKDADYIRNPSEFRFYEGVPEAIAGLAKVFRYIFVVTNQKGIGKGLMTEADLDAIHGQMLADIRSAGGRIDRIYHCPDLDEASPFRKPNPGMGFKARSEHPAVDLSKSVMVGNTMSDMQFGRSIGAWTVFIPSTKPMPELPHPLIDDCFQGLPALAKALIK
jgi:histidinol-phosphate phosphatase family protein